MDKPEAPAPHLVTKVAVAYELNALPPYLIQSFNVLRRKLERSGYQIEAVLRPLRSLPPEVDVVFVSADLQAAAELAAPAARIMPLAPDASHQPAYDELLGLLKAGQQLCAVRRPAGGEASDSAHRPTMRYRGHERID